VLLSWRELDVYKLSVVLKWDWEVYKLIVENLGQLQ
jgi:hypothetical protein